MTEIAPGELPDRFSILEIELQRMTYRAKLANASTELALLEEARDRNCPSSPRLASLAKQLGEVDETPWDVEDGLRDEERHEPFGARFTELARAVYWNNDERAAPKREIKVVLGSSIVEEKSYSDYGRSDEQRRRPDPAPGPS